MCTVEIKKQIEQKSKEMINIHKNTCWWYISEKQATLLGDRIELLDKEIEQLRELM